VAENLRPQGRRKDLVVQELAGEHLVYDLRKHKAHCLNQTSSVVWSACDGHRTIAEIQFVAEERLNSTVSEELVWLALDQLNKLDLIEGDFRIENNLPGLTRRQIIQKIGLASVVALPLVTSLAAPKAVHAASACGNVGQICNCPMGTGNGQPCSRQVCAVDCLCVRTGGCNAFSCAGTCS
jgi:hypothetical protein